ncbi:type II toxin-antitoxin system VapC family toxin [Sphingomonas nostoxanthinifaciens]|uniref:type II toxin-antitoxin system VapC family toxin n=1 Tax=Sphingomonas nostoxanthinifaciens TaxID=2872652 RepID=UPI001CC21F75|nr:type II toxin-antitoxin system VapC family toxin [Sphingomonas nostoxanthinifaciens]UAK25260.1 type II toxin-antitoxin system VapC family toxin [Sphingomonas nostoxanthinifaciens]
MRYLLDANACILLLAGHDNVVEHARQCDEDDLAISAIAFAEVALGSWNGKAPALVVLDTLSRRIPVLPFDELAAKRYAMLPFRRGSYDRLIAAHALALGLTIVTNNEADFADIPGLTVENWTLPPA